MACRTIVVAGIAGAVVMSQGPADQAAQPVPVGFTTTVVPLQPPVPPGPPVPPPMQEPGQQGPDTSIHDRPPPPAPAEPNEDAICQNVMLAPPECYLYDGNLPPDEA